MAKLKSSRILEREIWQELMLDLGATKIYFHKWLGALSVGPLLVLSVANVL